MVCNYIAFDFNLERAFWLKWEEQETIYEAQETIYETSKEVTKEEEYSQLGPLSRTRQIQMKYPAIKK